MYKTIGLLLKKALLFLIVILVSCNDKPPAQNTNMPPMAKAGSDQKVLQGSTVQLDGNASNDPNQDNLSYSWVLKSIPSTSNAVLSNAKIVNPTFVADKTGEYTVQLTVSDGELQDTDTLVVTATSTTSTNSPPRANAGNTQNVKSGDLVSLDGSASNDADGDTLSYSWGLTTPPDSNATLNNPNIVNPTFTADKDGKYTATLTVSDGTAQDTDTVIISAITNRPPRANAGEDQNVLRGSIVKLDGSASNDADGDSLSYSWDLMIPPQSSATLSNADTINPTFTADKDGKYTATLTVSDGIAQDVDIVVIVATKP